MEDAVSNWAGEIVAYVVGFVTAWAKAIWTYVKGWMDSNKPEDEEEVA